MSLTLRERKQEEKNGFKVWNNKDKKTKQTKTKQNKPSITYLFYILLHIAISALDLHRFVYVDSKGYHTSSHLIHIVGCIPLCKHLLDSLEYRKYYSMFDNK